MPIAVSPYLCQFHCFRPHPLENGASKLIIGIRMSFSPSHCPWRRRQEPVLPPVAYNIALFARQNHTMTHASPAVVTDSAYLTLHYRLAKTDGTDIVTTFAGNPATLMLGQGQ